MIGAIIFVIVFVLFLLIGLAGIGLPPGDWIIQEFIQDLSGTDYAPRARGSKEVVVKVDK